MLMTVSRLKERIFIDPRIFRELEAFRIEDSGKMIYRLLSSMKGTPPHMPTNKPRQILGKLDRKFAATLAADTLPI